MSAAYQIFQLPKGVPLNAGTIMPGAKASFYLTTTSTPTPVYTDSALSVPHTQPVQADSAGILPAIYLDPTITYKVTLTTSADVLYYTIDPANDQILSQAIIGQILYPQTAAEISAGVTPTNYGYNNSPHDVRRYGATEGGSVDCAAAFTSLAAVMAQGGDGVIPPGTWRLDSQVVFTAPGLIGVSLWAYGALIVSPTLANFPIAITGGAVTGGFTLAGIKIEHDSNTTSTGGIRAYNTWNLHLDDIIVECGGTSTPAANYAAIELDHGTPWTPDNGCIWANIHRPWIRVRGVSSNLPVGIRIKGQCNGVTIRGGLISDCIKAIHETFVTGHVDTSNALLVDGVSFEGYTDAYYFEGAAGGNMAGTRFIGCRFELGTRIFNLQGSPGQTQPPIAAFNMFTSDSGTYLTNPTGLSFNSLDACITPAIPQGEFLGSNGHRFTALADHAVIARVNVDNKGFALQKFNGTEIAFLGHQVGGLLPQLAGSSAGTLAVTGVQGISVTTTLSKNLRGSGTFSGASLTCAITFGTAEPDATYFIQITPTSDWGAQTKPPWITAKGTGGFTVNAQATTSSGTFDWVLIR